MGSWPRMRLVSAWQRVPLSFFRKSEAQFERCVTIRHMLHKYVHIHVLNNATGSLVTTTHFRTCGIMMHGPVFILFLFFFPVRPCRVCSS